MVEQDHIVIDPDSVQPMTLCWLTERDPFVLLGEMCHRLVYGAGATET
jgi:hypothetical protein